MRIKRFEAPGMSEALRMIKTEFGPNAVILSVRDLKKDGLMGFLQKPGVEVTAAVEAPRPGDSPAGLPSIEPDAVSISERYRQAAGGAKFPGNSPSGGNGQELSRLRNAMRTQDLAERFISLLLRNIEKNGGAPNPVDKLVPALKKNGILAGPAVAPFKGQKIIAFMGTAGVGKTTTIAKIAASQAIGRKRKTALLSLDRERIGAADHLERYARIIDVPYAAASTTGEMVRILKDFSHAELICVDTPGISHRDKARMNQLKELLSDLPRVENHLLVSALTKERDLLEIHEGFAEFPIHRLIFTKTDETSVFGPLFNLLLQTRIPVSCISTGRKIPEDLEDATVERLAGMLLGRNSEPALLSDARAGENSLPSSIFLVANRNSDIYHRSDCRCVSRIRRENRIVFENPSDAEKKRFTPCRMCRPSGKSTERESVIPEKNEAKHETR